MTPGVRFRAGEGDDFEAGWEDFEEEEEEFVGMGVGRLARIVTRERQKFPPWVI